MTSEKNMYHQTDRQRYNSVLCSEFPFLKCIFDEYDYEYTWLDNVSVGWRSMFLELCKGIKREIQKDLLNDFCILDVKEKFGGLRVYVLGANEEIERLLDEYEKKSRKICVGCGEPATHRTLGWVRFYCEKCLPTVLQSLPVEGEYE